MGKLLESLFYLCQLNNNILNFFFVLFEFNNLN